MIFIILIFILLFISNLVWGSKLEPRKETTQTTQSTDLGSSDTLIDETDEDKKLSVNKESTRLKEDSSLSQDLSTSFADDEERLAASASGTEQSVSIAESEKSFRRHFQSITHRMIHRRASMELYKRIMNNTFGKHLDQQSLFAFCSNFEQKCPNF